MKSSESIADNLHDAQQKLTTFIQHLLPDYAKKMVWDAEGKLISVDNKSQALPDPAIVQLSKHCLLALQEAEIVAKGASTVLGRYQEKGVRGIVAGEIHDVMPIFLAISEYSNQDHSSLSPEERKKAKQKTDQEVEELFKNKKTQGAEVYFAAQRLSTHLKAITKILTDSNFSTETTDQLTTITESLRNFSPKTLKTLMSGQFPNLSETLSHVVTTYFTNNRPAAPVRPEQQYTSKKNIPCVFLTKTPNYQNDKQLKPNSYVVIKKSNEPWQLVYLNESLQPYPINMSDIPPQLQSLLDQAQSINQFLDKAHVLVNKDWLMTI